MAVGTRILGRWGLWSLLGALLLTGGAGTAAAQVKVEASGSLPGGEGAPEEGVILQPTHKEKYVIMPRVGYFRAFTAFGPNPDTLGDPNDTDDLGRNNATSMGDGRWDVVGQWTAGLEYRQDLGRKNFFSLDLHGVLIGEAGYGLRKLPPFKDPKSLGAGSSTALAAVGVGHYFQLGDSRLTWLRVGGKLGYLYGVATPAWLNVELQRHVMLADESYLSISLQGMAGLMLPSAIPDFSEQFTRKLWTDQMRGIAGFQLGIARVFPDRATRFENPKDKVPEGIPLGK